MKIDFDKILTPEECASLTLRSIYAEYGYSQYRMSKFEEYDLYSKNKDFLVSDNLITFTDTDGRLLALKPDVTLSIIKNTKDTESGVLKVYYNENVYRVSKNTHSFREIMQSGVECIGDVGKDEICEVLYLAAKSLDAVSEDYVLEISHIDIVSELLSAFGANDELKNAIFACLSEKNAKGAFDIAVRDGITRENAELLADLISLHGTPSAVLAKLGAYALTDEISSAIDELTKITAELSSIGLSDKVRIDFSVINNTNYYNGIAFRGFIDGVPTAALLGGQYDKMMNRMKRRSRAVGFAVYLDELTKKR